MSEIQFQIARNGERLFSLAGRSLASQFNPSREAEQWVIAQEKLLQNIDVAIVLGIGCGYHVKALKQLTDVLVVESQKSVRDAALSLHPGILRDSEVLIAGEPEDLCDDARIKQVVLGAYAVLIPAAGYVSFPRVADLAQFLLGRSQSGLEWHCGLRNWIVPKAQAAIWALNDLNPLLESDQNELDCLRAVRELIA